MNGKKGTQEHCGLEDVARGKGERRELGANPQTRSRRNGQFRQEEYKYLSVLLHVG
jgi:hypothetical protein